MAKGATQRQFLASKLDALNEAELQDVLEYINSLESRKLSQATTSKWEVEVLSVLAEARENRRARQAFEWETVRRKAERRVSKANAGTWNG